MLRVVRIPSGVLKIVKEVLRHLLRRPVVGIAAAARTPDGRLLLIRRADSGLWALPGGTLEWGETLRSAITREVFEETGARVTALGDMIGAYSEPGRDPRFHAVTLVVAASVTDPDQGRVKLGSGVSGTYFHNLGQFENRCPTRLTRISGHTP